MRKNLTVLIISVIVLVLAFVSFFGVWYNSQVSFISSSDMGISDSSYFLTEVTNNAKDLKTGTSSSNTYNYIYLKNLVSTIYDDPSVPTNMLNTQMGIFDTYNILFYVMLIIILISSLTLICYLWLITHISKNNLIHYAITVFSLALFIISFVMIIGFAVQYEFLQREMLHDSSGSITNFTGGVGFWTNSTYEFTNSQTSMYYTSGPGYAWYLMIICAILSIIGYGFIRKKSVVKPLITDFRDTKKEIDKKEVENQKSYQDE